MRRNTAGLHISNLISTLLPQTRAFGIRRALYRAAGVEVGRNVRINGGVVFQYPNVSLGDGTWVGRRTEFVATPQAGITVGARCDISQDVLFITGSHEIGDSQHRAGPGKSMPIEVGDGTWIGARVILLGGCSVGAGTIVAAGSLVRDNFPGNALIAGSPAKLVRQLE